MLVIQPGLRGRTKYFPKYTIETMTTFQEAGPFTTRGNSAKTIVIWTRAEDLGQGVSGEVHREYQSEDNTLPESRAVKIMRRRQLTRMEIDYKRELSALMRLARDDYNHHFVEFYTWYESHQSISIAMEYIPGGDLSRYIGQHIEKKEIVAIASQIAEGLSVLHCLDIVHRDIKPAVGSDKHCAL